MILTVSIPKRPITPPATLGGLEYQNPDHEQLMKRLRPAQSVEEVMFGLYCCTHSTFCRISNKSNHSFTCDFQVSYPAPRQQGTWSLDDLPRAVAFTLHQGSNVTSMDFHPSHYMLLLG